MDEQQVQEIRLKTGDLVPTPTVAAILPQLEGLLETMPMALFDLREICRDETYQPFDNIADELTQRLLIKQRADDPARWIVHADVKAVVLSALKGEGADTCLVDPREDTGPPGLGGAR